MISPKIRGDINCFSVGISFSQVITGQREVGRKKFESGERGSAKLKKGRV